MMNIFFALFIDETSNIKIKFKDPYYRCGTVDVISYPGPTGIYKVYLYLEL